MISFILSALVQAIPPVQSAAILQQAVGDISVTLSSTLAATSTQNIAKTSATAATLSISDTAITTSATAPPSSATISKVTSNIVTTSSLESTSSVSTVSSNSLPFSTTENSISSIATSTEVVSSSSNATPSSQQPVPAAQFTTPSNPVVTQQEQQANPIAGAVPSIAAPIKKAAPKSVNQAPVPSSINQESTPIAVKQVNSVNQIAAPIAANQASLPASVNPSIPLTQASISLPLQASAGQQAILATNNPAVKSQITTDVVSVTVLAPNPSNLPDSSLPLSSTPPKIALAVSQGIAPSVDNAPVAKVPDLPVTAPLVTATTSPSVDGTSATPNLIQESAVDSSPPITAIVGGSIGGLILLFTVLFFLRKFLVRRKGKINRSINTLNSPNMSSINIPEPIQLSADSSPTNNSNVEESIFNRRVSDSSSFGPVGDDARLIDRRASVAYSDSILSDPGDFVQPPELNPNLADMSQRPKVVRRFSQNLVTAAMRLANNESEKHESIDSMSSLFDYDQEFRNALKK